MNFMYNGLESIEEIVLKKAKYQKVMLVFDDTVTSVEINKIYEKIKNKCIYNTSHITSLDNEIYNGYKLLIFLCSADSFLKLKCNLSEFVNVFVLKNNEILPFYLNVCSKVEPNENYLISSSCTIDTSAMSSLFFVNFYSYFDKLVSQNESEILTECMPKEISYSSIVACLESFKSEQFFIDVDLIRTEGVSYEMLPVVDLILIDAFLVFLSCVKNNTLMLVDIYKSAKDDNNLIDKFYKQVNNDSFLTIINLNYSFLLNKCKETKNSILKLIDARHLDFRQSEILEKVKHYLKFCDESLGYLYLYDVFNY